jgi:hypothetical protein
MKITFFTAAPARLQLQLLSGNPHRMSKGRSEVMEESKRKGLVAGVAAAATVALGVTVGAPLAAVAAVPTAILGWRWWKHRIENGIRF